MYIPEGYETTLSLRETEKGINDIKKMFEKKLEEELNLMRISAPLFLRPETGLNDNLNNIERPVSFDAKNMNGTFEIVQSLAKWKRDALKRYSFSPGEGIYTDMNAIRRDEDLSNIHSFYVDQWDYEKIIYEEERTKDYLFETVSKIYSILREVQLSIQMQYPSLVSEKRWNLLPSDIFFISSQELEDMYPHLTPKERENTITREKGAVFIFQIGNRLDSGNVHDNRAYDYDSWKLNGDILVWNTVLEEALEISSMGIRVNRDDLLAQAEDRDLSTPYHQSVLNGTLPLTIGGGIGQSRVCMYLLKKCHIGEVQCSVWDTHTLEQCSQHGVQLL